MGAEDRPAIAPVRKIRGVVRLKAARHRGSESYREENDPPGMEPGSRHRTHRKTVPAGAIPTARTSGLYATWRSERKPSWTGRAYRVPDPIERFTAEGTESAEETQNMNGFVSAPSAFSAVNDRDLGNAEWHCHIFLAFQLSFLQLPLRCVACRESFMIEPDWLKAKDPAAMLRSVADRLTTRRWHLLACAVVRRSWDALPDGPFRDAINWAEQHAGELPGLPAASAKVRELENASDSAIEASRAAQHEIVRTADPDANPEDFRHTDARKTNPAAPLFQAACTHAGASVEQAAEATTVATRAVAALLREQPGFTLLDRLRTAIVEATRMRAIANLRASSALELKLLGDEAADRNTGKNVRLQYAAALETVRRKEEHFGYRSNDLGEGREKADLKSLGRFLHEIIGNPFKPYRFEPEWRTSTVVGLANAIVAERAFDRMPILADALLDADCDEEAILRHCRGTETHTPDGPLHIRGCWVLDLILEREPAMFSLPTMAAPPPPPPPPVRRASGGAAAGGQNDSMMRLFEALRQGMPLDDDDEDDDKE